MRYAWAVRVVGWVLVVLGAIVAVPPLSFVLVNTVMDHTWDEQGIIRWLCFMASAIGACVAGIGGLMVWVATPKKP